MELPRLLPLTGADCFLRAFDWQTRRRSGASHLSQLVLELGPGFDAGHFETVLHEIARACPIVRSPIRRPGLGAPVYRLDLAHEAPLPRVEQHPLGSARDAHGTPRVFFERLNSIFALRRGELLAADIVPRKDGTDLALTWAHMLMDGAGSENLLAHLSAVADGQRDPRDVPPDEWSADVDLSFTRARFLEVPEGEDRIPGALENVVAAGLTYMPVGDGPLGAIRLRHFGSYPMIEDGSERARASSLVNAEVGYRYRDVRLAVSVLNALEEESSDIQYYYESRLAGEPAGGVSDLHFHPAEPRQIRVSLSWGM